MQYTYDWWWYLQTFYVCNTARFAKNRILKDLDNFVFDTGSHLIKVPLHKNTAQYTHYIYGI